MKRRSHGITPPRARTLGEQGTKVARLRYDAEIEFFRGYLEEKRHQQHQDGLKHRRQLTSLGAHLIRIIERHIDVLERMLKISRRFMDDDMQKRPLPTTKRSDG